MLVVEQLAKAYGAQTVLREITFAVGRGERVGLVGPNGAGKSTLLRSIAGEVAPDAGLIRIDPAASVGYLPQTAAALPGRTIGDVVDVALIELRTCERRLRALEAEMRTAGGAALAAALAEYGELTERFEQLGGYEAEHRVAAVLAGLGLAAIDRERQLASLSGGERSRLLLAGLLLRAPDLLLLDEPTNHISLDVLEEFERALLDFPGAIVAVSHDRRFIERCAGELWELRDGRLRQQPGGFAAYLVALGRAA